MLHNVIESTVIILFLINFLTFHKHLDENSASQFQIICAACVCIHHTAYKQLITAAPLI